jgi:heme/copper-type cytochrome/quinol oxidase subunit 3
MDKLNNYNDVTNEKERVAEEMRENEYLKNEVRNTVELLNERKLYKTEKELDYWDQYLAKDVEFVKERRHYHYYNEIPYTMWPIYICNALFYVIFYGILALNGQDYVAIFSISSLCVMVFAIMLWFYDLLNESMMFGKYNRKLRSVIVAGFMIFLASEVFLFGGFFWAFFDRFFHTPAILGGVSVPMGIEVFVWYKKPLYATLILLFSAIAFNGASYCMKWGSWTYAVAYSTFGILLGCIFLIIQVHEYKHLTFNITDTVYGSCFYLLTGFHGFHVVVGMIFLTIQHERLISWQFTRERHLGYSLAMIHWHFVDIVWIFLFIFVYVLNTMGYQDFVYV